MNAGHRYKKLLIGSLACAALSVIRTAHAELVLYDKDGWTLKHDGLAQGFYMFSTGDTDPTGGTAPPIRFDFIGTTAGNAQNKFFSSRFRSGWTGGRFNWVAEKRISEDTKASAHLGIAYSISTYNAPPATNNNWDVRFGFLQIEGPWGDVIIGRHVGLYTLGAIISTMAMTSAPLGLGNECDSKGDSLSCYTSGFGVKFPGFWAGLIYDTPVLAGGLKIRLAAFDPKSAGHDRVEGGAPVSQEWAKTPLPMFQTLIRYEGNLSDTVKVNPYFNGFWQQVGRAPGMGRTNVDETLNPMGGGAGIDFFFGDFKIGGGGEIEHGTGLHGPLYGDDSIDGSGALRDGVSFYAHALYSLGPVDISGGVGQAGLKRSTFDEANNLNINKSQRNIHAALQYHMDPLHFVAEVNLLHLAWHLGNTQDIQVISLGADFVY